MNYNKQIEANIIACLLTDNSTLSVVEDIISTADFYLLEHKLMFEKLSKMINEGKKVDLMLLDDTLKTLDYYQEAGGLSYLAEIMRDLPTVTNAKAYADVVKKKSIQRSLEETTSKRVNSEDDPESYIEELERELDQIKNNLADKEDFIVKPEQSLTHLLNKYDDMCEKGTDISGISTGYESLDYVINGLNPGKMIVVGARPGMGKTAFSLNIANHVAESDKSVLFFSLEMEHDEIAERMLAMKSRISYKKITRALIEEHEWGPLGLKMNEYKKSNFFVVDRPGITCHDLRYFIKTHVKKYDLGLVIIDYMQLMKEPRLSRNRVQEVSYISMELKNIAKEFKVPIIALSQLNRSLENRENKRPQLSDLRESGSIEQDADIIMFLYRDDQYYDEAIQGLAEISISKNRGGENKILSFNFEGEFVTFKENKQEIRF